MTDKQIKTKVFVNTLMETSLVEKLDRMVEEHGSTRSQFIRLLVRQQWSKRQDCKPDKKEKRVV